MPGICWVAGQLLATQEAFSSMEFASVQSDKKQIHKFRRRPEGTVLCPTVHANMSKAELSMCLIKHHPKNKNTQKCWYSVTHSADE
jgi:hypothetical protein